MKLSDYKETKLSIYEKAADGVISDNDKVKLLAMLEAKKDEETLSEEDIESSSRTSQTCILILKRISKSYLTR